MPLVIDALVTAAWILPDEQTPNALQARSIVVQEGGQVPLHWWDEVRNTLLMAERRNRTTPELTAAALATLDELPILQTRTADGAAILALARRHRLTFYDAAYLELAVRNNLDLATLDAVLARAAIAEGVPVVGTH